MEEKDLERLVLQGLEIESVEKEKASERKALTRKHGLKLEDAKYSQGTRGQTRDIVGEQLGISGRQWERMRFIYQHRDCLSKDEYNNWRAGKLSTSKLYKKISEDLRYDDILDRMLEILDSMQLEAIGYEKSKVHMDIQHSLNSAMFSCRDKTKTDIQNCFDRLKRYNTIYLNSRFNKITDMKMEISDLKEKLKYKTHNHV